MKYKDISNQNRTPSKTQKSRVDRKALKKELRILVECLGFGNNRYREFPEYNIKNSSVLKARINELIDLISK